MPAEVGASPAAEARPAIRVASPAEYAEIGELTVRAYATVGDPLQGSPTYAAYEDELRDVAGRAATCQVLVAVEPRRADPRRGDLRAGTGDAVVRDGARRRGRVPGPGGRPRVARRRHRPRARDRHASSAREGWPRWRRDPHPPIDDRRASPVRIARVRPRPVARLGVRAGRVALVLRAHVLTWTRHRRSSRPRPRPSSCSGHGRGRVRGPADAAAVVDGVRPGHARLPGRPGGRRRCRHPASFGARSCRGGCRAVALGGDLAPAAARWRRMSRRSASCSRRPACCWPTPAARALRSRPGPLSEARSALVGGDAGFESIAAELDLRLRTDRLVALSRWVTPPTLPRRFDARFFAAELPAGARVSFEGGEVAGHRWLTPGRRAGRDGRRTDRDVAADERHAPAARARDLDRAGRASSCAGPLRDRGGGDLART